MNTASQVLFFCVVGACNTAIDFTIYNLLSRRPFALPRIPSNIVSVAIAMSFSFAVNLLFVFRPETLLWGERMVRFLIVTTFSMYVLQNLVIFWSSRILQVRLRFAVVALRAVPPAKHLTHETVERNLAKILATVCSLVWNFAFYKLYVYGT